MAATPFSTGGGGTNFEQAFAATQLVGLLRGDAVPVLGDGVRLGSVRFQAAPLSDVDDLLLRSDPADGPVRTASVASRHAPKIAASDKKFVDLLATMAKTFAAHRDECRLRTWRIGLVVAAPHSGATTLVKVTDVARAQPVTGDFEQAIQTAAKPVRGRFRWFGQALDKALSSPGFTGDAGSPGSSERATFRHEFLAALHIFQLDLLGDDAADRSCAIQQLTQLTAGPAVAVDVWDALVTLVTNANPQGATLDEPELRRRLPGHHINPGTRRTAGLATLAALEQSQRARVRSQLIQPATAGAASPPPLHLPRPTALSALLTAISASRAALIITGTAGTGKSALTTEAITELRAGGAHVVALHAADCAGVGGGADPFGGLLVETLGCATTAQQRYLIIDGAETTAGLELLVAAGLQAGYRPLVVVRDDAADEVRDVLTRALAASESTAAPEEHTVAAMTEGEVAQVVARFSILAMIAARPRAADLMSRPGLVDTMLRAHPAPASGEDPLTELDLFDAFWTRVVASAGGGASASGRDQAAISIARMVLLPGAPPVVAEPAAVDALRRDGLLARYSSFAGRDAFASDLYLDFATARLLTTDGLGILIHASAPRWALRAARLAIQARLTLDGTAALPAIQQDLTAIAAIHGDRWLQLIDEAVLEHPAAGHFLQQMWPALADDLTALKDLLAIATSRFCPEGVAITGAPGSRRTGPNPALDALAPLIDVLIAHDSAIAAMSRETRGAYDELLLGFLRGAAWHRFASRHADTVHRIAAAIAARGTNRAGAAPAEAFALVGADFDAIGRPVLLALSTDRPQELDMVVESRYSVSALAEQDPTLLADLALAYYLEPGSVGLFSRHDEGVRDHCLHLRPLRIGGGLDRGPFLRLLLADPAQGLRLIHAVLERGAATRQRRMGHRSLPEGWPVTAAEEATREPVTLALPGLGTRTYVGDSQAWYWYRGSGVGPEPCISAAMALEFYADRLLARGLELGGVILLVMAGARSLAECGVAFGLLVRNRPGSGPVIAGWLRERLIWELENERITREHNAVKRADEDPELRRLVANSLATQLVIEAIQAEDNIQLRRLAEAADALEQPIADLDDSTRAAIVRLSAALLRVENYVPVEQPDGTVELVPRLPEATVAPLQDSNQELAWVGIALRLKMDYSPGLMTHPVRLHSISYLTPAGRLPIPALAARGSEPAQSAARLRRDLQLARTLADNPRPYLLAVAGASPSSAVAAVLLTGNLGDLATDQDRDWAVATLTQAAATLETFEDRDTNDDQLASRAAARALPTAFARGSGGRDLEILSALHTLATHPALEARRTLAVNLRAIWEAPCRITASGRCLHQDAGGVVMSFVRDAVLPGGPDDPAVAIDGLEMLTAQSADALDVGVLGPAVAAVIDASAHCVCPNLVDVLPQVEEALTEVFVQSLAYRFDGSAVEMIATAAAGQAGRSGSIERLRAISVRLVGSGALSAWHAGIRDAVSREPSLGPVIGAGWADLATELFPLVADAVDLASLLPPGGGDWPTPADLPDLLPGWLAAAGGHADAIDTYCTWATMNSVACADVLDALDQLIPDPRIVTQLWRIGDLFEQLLARPGTTQDESRLYRWIDAFAAAGATRFLHLQRDPI